MKTSMKNEDTKTITKTDKIDILAKASHLKPNLTYFAFKR